jgi:hypothetical protein
MLNLCGGYRCGWLSLARCCCMQWQLIQLLVLLGLSHVKTLGGVHVGMPNSAHIISLATHPCGLAT